MMVRGERRGLPWPCGRGSSAPSVPSVTGGRLSTLAVIGILGEVIDALLELFV